MISSASNSPARRFLAWCIGIALIATFALYCVSRFSHGSTGEASDFAKALDFERFGRVAVYNDGRIKSFESHASSTLNIISGSRKVDGQPHVVSYLDFLLRPIENFDTNAVIVKAKPMRGAIVRLLRDDPTARVGSTEEDFDARLDHFAKTGLTSDRLLNQASVQRYLEEASEDLRRTARFVEQIRSSMFVKSPRYLNQDLRIVPPPSGDRNEPWLTIEEYLAFAATEGGGIEATLVDALAAGWADLQAGWKMQDATQVNAALDALAAALPTVEPQLYPTASREGWPWSLKDANLWSWVSVAGLLLTGLLTLFVGGPRTRAFGATLLVGLLGFHVVALWLNGEGTGDPLFWESWYFRANNLTWVWLLYCVTLVPLLMSVIYRWNAARWVGLVMFMAAFGLHTFALVLRWYVADRWPNSNMFEAVTTAAWMGGVLAVVLEMMVGRSRMRTLFALTSASASMVALMCAHYMPMQLNPNISNMMPVLHDVWLYIHTNVIIFSYALIGMAAIAGIAYVLYRVGGGKADYARAGGAASMIMVNPDGTPRMESDRTTAGQVLDGAVMVLMELAFILLWAGLVMGAIWADHSWGRPWGWDPKEVFALNTFIILALLVHVRLKVKDKGLWTALLAIFGAIVMLFNWIFINFFLVGLHSYA